MSDALMTAAEFYALANRTLKVADGIVANPVEEMCAAYRRAISEVERLKQQVEGIARESRAEVERVTKERDALQAENNRWIGEDRDRLDWLDAEQRRVDPVAALLVKRSHDRNGEWGNTAGPVRDMLDAARGAVRGDAAIREEAGTSKVTAKVGTSPVQPPREDDGPDCDLCDAPAEAHPTATCGVVFIQPPADRSEGFEDTYNWELPPLQETTVLVSAVPAEPPADREPPSDDRYWNPPSPDLWYTCQEHGTTRGGCCFSGVELDPQPTPDAGVIPSGVLIEMGRRAEAESIAKFDHPPIVPSPLRPVPAGLQEFEKAVNDLQFRAVVHWKARHQGHDHNDTLKCSWCSAARTEVMRLWREK